MNKKNLIQIVIICACFAASGIVIYNNFIKKPSYSAVIPQNLPSAAVANINEPILPNGNNFDLSRIKNSKLRFNLVDYPRVEYPIDVGVDEQNLIKPIQLMQTGGPPQKR